MRLLDRILSGGFKESEGVNFSKTTINDHLRSSQLVVIDNVADYFFNHRFGGDIVTINDFPSIMLPFEFCFLEFRFRQQWKIETGCDEVGMLLMMAPPDTRRTEEVLWPAGVKYHLACYTFVRQLGSDAAFLFSEMVLPVSETGQLLSPNERVHALTNILTLGINEEEFRRNLRFTHQYVSFPVFLALSFMHCRNVKVATETPPAPLSKKHERKTGRPLLKYRVLQIDHMKQVLEREGGASTGGLKKALHICRGHFKNYGRDGKGLLFGKYTATVWIPMHARGSAEEGVVVKDYDVK